MFVRAVIVCDQVQVQFRRCLFVNLFEELGPFLMPVPLHARADQFSLRHVQGRKQRRRSIAFVIMCHGPASSLL